VTERLPGQALAVPGNTPGNPGACDDDARWREAARLRSQFRGWIVIWLARENCFKAYKRLPGARRDTALSAATSAEMADLIGQAEQAAARPAWRAKGAR
jgi:hypothetical protein